MVFVSDLVADLRAGRQPLSLGKERLAASDSRRDRAGGDHGCSGVGQI